MAKKDSKSEQVKPGKTTRKGIRPNVGKKSAAKVVYHTLPGGGTRGEVVVLREGKNKLPVAKGFNPETKTWDSQSHGL
jgi:hypothetical protein